MRHRRRVILNTTIAALVAIGCFSGKPIPTAIGAALNTQTTDGGAGGEAWQVIAAADLRDPRGVTADDDGNIWVADAGFNWVQKLSPTGQRLAQWGGSGNGPGEFGRGGPTSIAVDRQGNVYVADIGNHRVQKLSPSGEPLAQWGPFGTERLEGRSYRPTDFTIAVNDAREIYVADGANRGIQKLSPEGQSLAHWDTKGVVGIAATGSDVYIGVAENGSLRVQRLSASEEPAAQWTVGDTLPVRLAADREGNFYVADRWYRVSKFSNSGELVAEWGGQGSAPGHFGNISGLAVDGQGNLYVAVRASPVGSPRIQKLPATATSWGFLDRTAHTAIWTGTEMIIWGGDSYTGNASRYLADGARFNPRAGSRARTSMVDVPVARAYHTAVWTGTEMIVWGGDALLPSPRDRSDGGRYDPRTDAWRPISTLNAPSGRLRHTAVWTGREMLVWGGQCCLDRGRERLGDGGRYDPATDSWTPISTMGAPVARVGHTAVWTGTEMIIWAGVNGGADDGASYDPRTDTWRPVSVVNAPSDRSGHTAVWTGKEMVVWGGSQTNDGGRYDPVRDVWTPMSDAGAPSARSLHSSVWTGTEMLVWGGRVCQWCGQPGEAFAADGARYNAAVDIWTTISSARTASGRSGHSAVWTGSEMLLWGGLGEGGHVAGGPRYDPSTDRWTTSSSLL